MENNEIKQDTSEEQEEMQVKQPNEIPGVNVEGFIKIFVNKAYFLVFFFKDGFFFKGVVNCVNRQTL